jgi:hypothetical protein
MGLVDCTLILAVPVVVIALVGAVFRWESKRWEARCRAAARPTAVTLFPHGPQPLYPPLDTRAGRAARRARHGGTT